MLSEENSKDWLDMAAGSKGSTSARSSMERPRSEGSIADKPPATRRRMYKVVVVPQSYAIESEIFCSGANRLLGICNTVALMASIAAFKVDRICLKPVLLI
jgi:hypothetical protein